MAGLRATRLAIDPGPKACGPSKEIEGNDLPDSFLLFSFGMFHVEHIVNCSISHVFHVPLLE